MLITGAMLRQARVDAGISLSEMARRLYLDKGYLSRVETRHDVVPVHIVDKYEQALGVDMNRRELLGLAGSAVLPGVLAEALRRGIDQAATPTPSVDDWKGKLELHATDALTIGTSEMQIRLASELVLLQGHLVEPQMWAIAARLMVLHGAPLACVGDLAAIEAWYRTTVAAADRSSDTATQVWVRGRSALNMAHPSAPTDLCREFATDAVALAERPSVGRLMAFVSLANIDALVGETAASMASLACARREFDAVGSTNGEVSEHTMPDWRMNVDESLLLSRLCHPRACEAHDRAARSIPPAYARFATHLDLHRGLTMAKAGDRVGGVAHAREALGSLPAKRHSVALRRLFTEVAK